MKYLFWLNIGFTSKISAEKFLYSRNTVFYIEEIVLQNNSFTLEILEMISENISANIGVILTNHKHPNVEALNIS